MTKKKTKLMIIVISAVLAFVTLLSVFTAIRLSDTIKTKDVSWTAYSVGSISEDGNLEDNKKAICTKDFITVDGLTCELDEEAEISYRLFYYDKDSKFISSSSFLNEDTTSVTVENAEFIRIVIIPTKDVEIGLTDIYKYAKQLTVTVNK